jgi:two-component system CheB/CheR fusion protein
VAGTVSYRQNDNALYIQDASEGLYAETRQEGTLLPGDLVEVLGFPAKGEYTPMLQDAVFRKLGSGSLPKPDEVTADEALSGAHDCRLVRMKATVLDRARKSRDEFLVLQSGGFIFQAYLERSAHGTDFSYLENNSEISVTGVCLIEKGTDWFAGGGWRAKSFRILMRSPGDILVLRRPPWWNLRKMLWVLGTAVMVILAVLAWVAVLRRRVQTQTEIIRHQLQTEEQLKERYQDLFENANDVVFTHDLDGRITSINNAGEKLLQHSKSQIVGKPLLDFIADEERSEAAQWLEEVVRGVDVPPVEWHLVGGAGQRLKVEISSRIVAQAGAKTEVEGIARDITERKRLEKEILEVSNREQRRIGHDLHDGVCQQLAGIAYLTDILADRLEGEGDNYSTEAEKISGLINDTITQTRTVARGLFPVRLEENGLLSALEEFATNASTLYKIDCRFAYNEPMPALENGVALHLYYIVQEAVLNAVKHGKASQITISLGSANGRYALSVKDDGRGFDSSNSAGPGMGIRIMRYRARVIDATLDLKSRPGHGTQITCGFYPGSSQSPEGHQNERKQESKPVI